MILRPFLLPIKILYYLGIWQDENSSKLYKFYGAFLFFYLQVHGSINQSVFVVKHLMSGDFHEAFETLSILLTCSVTITKSLIFVMSISKIQKLMKSLRKLLKFSNFLEVKKRHQVESYEASIIKISNLNYTFHFAVCNLSMMIAIVFINERRLPFKTWFYMDYKNDIFVYIYLVSNEYFISVYTILINGSLDVFPVIFMCYVNAMLKELNEKINLLKENMLKNEVDLRKCVGLHVKIKDFCGVISETYALHFLIQGFFSALILCSSTFLLSKVN